ncbi:MAG: transcription antitermination factor NusB [Mariprofundaceae bacterium]
MANRHKSRQSALEILYAWESGGRESESIPALLAGRLQQHDRRSQDEAFLREAVLHVTTHRDELDALVSKSVGGRRLDNLGMIELNILRLAVWELKERLEIPYRVVINEALNLSRAYADEHSCAFVNGVLDRIARQLRKAEAASAKA